MSLFLLFTFPPSIALFYRLNLSLMAVYTYLSSPLLKSQMAIETNLSGTNLFESQLTSVYFLYLSFHFIGTKVLCGLLSAEPQPDLWER